MAASDRIWLPESARTSATPGGWLDRARRAAAQPATSPVLNRADRRRFERQARKAAKGTR